MSTIEECIIIINDQRFALSRDQIMRDAPNYFTAFFEGPFKEASEGVREMKLYRDPYLFKFIHLYLSGYEILPLPKHNIPHYFSEESRLNNLLLDAHFYGLDSLSEELEVAIRPMKGSGTSEKAQDGQTEEQMWKIYTREEGDHWTYTMTLHDRTAYAYYTEGAKKNSSYRVIPFNVSEIADGLESIYTYTYWVDDGRTQGHKCFAIGKVKGT